MTSIRTNNFVLVVDLRESGCDFEESFERGSLGYLIDRTLHVVQKVMLPIPLRQQKTWIQIIILIMFQELTRLANCKSDRGQITSSVEVLALKLLTSLI